MGFGGFLFGVPLAWLLSREALLRMCPNPGGKTWQPVSRDGIMPWPGPSEQDTADIRVSCPLFCERLR